MTRFRAWAPAASSVELALGADGADRRPMDPEERGWWALDAPDAGPGTDYAFAIDGAGPFPDPRSSFQPAGIHGPSRLLDHGAFEWTDGAWTASPFEDAIVYELHVGTFSEAGTFDGAIEHLDHLVALGVTHVELMPVVEFPGVRGWGYDGVDLFAPHHAYGGPDGLKRLVDACHGRRIGVLLDVVYNHLGPDGNYLGAFGPYFSRRYTTPWGDAVNFDGPGSDEVRAFVVDNALGWVRDYHVDGLRIDAVHEMFDRSAVHILEELAAAVHEAGGVVVAESDLNDPRLVEPVERGGFGLDAHWNDDFRHALHVALTGERDRFHEQYRGLPDLATTLEAIYAFARRYSPYRDRQHGREVPADLPASRFVGFLQNHDQVGNRPFGERISDLVPVEAAMAGAAVVLLSPFVPLLFAGEEWAASTPFRYFTDHQDPGLAAAVSAGRRAEFGAFVRDDAELPDPQDRDSFRRSRLRWEEPASRAGGRVLDWYRRLIAYRHDHPVLRDGSRPAVRFDEQQCWLTAERGGITLVVNVSPRRQSVPLDRPDGWRVALASLDGWALEGPRIELPGWGVAVLERDGA